MITNNPSVSINRNVAMKREIAKADSASINAANTASVNTSAESHKSALKSAFADFAQSRESVLTPASANDANAGSQVQEEFRQQFTDLASDSKKFHGVLWDAFGEHYDVQAGEAIRQQTLSGDFSWMPAFEFVDGSVLGNGVGAYDSENDRILLNNEFKGSDLLSSVFTEEAGHALDARLNTSDTAGDEGELFQKLLAGDAPTTAERLRMLNDNDHGTVTVNGKRVDVEFFSIKIPNPFKIIKNEVIEPALDFAKNEIIEPLNKTVVKPLKNQLIDPVIDFGESVVDIGTDLAKFPFEVGQSLFKGNKKLIQSLLQGDLSAAGYAVINTIKQVGADSISQFTDTAVMGAHAVVNLAESVFGSINERALSQKEIAYLRPIYGDSIDYSEVTIQTGGLKELLGTIGLRAHVIGNDIFLPDNLFKPDGSGLTDIGLRTLGHEMGHVWQFQNLGPDYISGALAAQFSQGSGGVGTGEGYDWLAFANDGVRFNDMNEESQAELASFIGLSIHPLTDRVDEGLLNSAIANELKIKLPDTYAISARTLAIVNEAHDILLAGG